MKFGTWSFDESGSSIYRGMFYYVRVCAGVNLTAESDSGQLDAYVKSGEWDLEGKEKND